MNATPSAYLVAFLAFWLTPLLTAGEPAPLDKIDLNDGDCLVFLGDSITHQCLYTQYVEDFFYTRFPGRRPRFHNAGVGGARAWDALRRFDRDVAAYEPKYVTVLLGMNDGSYRPFSEEIYQTYRQDMTEVVREIQEIGATPVLMTPTMYDARAARAGKRKSDPASVELYNAVLAYYGAWLREVAVEGGFGFVDMYSPLNNLTLSQRKRDSSFTLIRDAVHPGASGQLVMATALLEDMGLRGQLSNIRIILQGTEPAIRANGGEVRDLKYTEQELSFDWLAEGLPFVVPDDARQGADLLKLGRRMSREALAVNGLPAGRYELSIDGEPVGRYTSVALARNVELQGNEKTPQYRQAMEVVTKNRERNRGPVRALRGEWSKFQQYARLEKQADSRPDDKEAGAKLAKSKEQIEGIEERIAKHESAAGAIEDEIYRLNRPRPRKYVLRRVRGRAANATSGASRRGGGGLVSADAEPQRLFTRSVGIEGGLTEGAAVAPDGGIYFSDILRGEDRGMILRFDPTSGETTVFADDSGKSNGLIFDSDGHLLACEGADHGGRRVSRWNVKTKQRVTLTDRYEGKRFNSPNDLCIDRRGRIYFTDPRYLGHEIRELDTQAVYRIDPDGRVAEVTRHVAKPNGIAISPDGKTLYVADHDNGTDQIDAASSPPQGDMKIYAFRLDPGSGTAHDRRTIVDFGAKKGCDGMTVDRRGNLYLTVRDGSRPGVMIVNPEGKEVGFIPTGPPNQTGDALVGLPSNVEFGIGDESNVLYVTVDTSLYRIRLRANGFHRQYLERR